MDGVLITAATDSNEPVSQAARMCRKRGRIVLVGVAGLSSSGRSSTRRSCRSRCPAPTVRDATIPSTRSEGSDYPAGFVRWTEQRNFEAVLEMLRSRRLDVRPLISHRFAFDAAPAPTSCSLNGAPSPASASCSSTRCRRAEHAAADARSRSQCRTPRALRACARCRLASAPAITPRACWRRRSRRAARGCCGIASSGGVTAAHCARKFGFAARHDRRRRADLGRRRRYRRHRHAA